MDISQYCHDFFGRPVIVQDTSYNVLAQFPNQEIGDPIWDFQYRNRSLDASTISEYYTHKMIDTLFAAEGAVLVDWGVVSKCPRIACAVRNGSEVLGSVGILCPDGNYDECDFENVKVTAQALGIVMSRELRTASGNSPLHSENNLLEVMMSLLFQGRVRTRQDLELWKSNMGVSLSPGYRVFALVPGKASTGQTFMLANIQKRVKSQYQGMYSTLCDGVFFILFTGQRTTLDDKGMLNDIMSILQLVSGYQIPFGISNCFSSLLELETYKYQAIRAAQLCSSDEQDVLAHFYSNLVLRDILSNGTDNMQTVCYMHPALETLKEIDRTQGTNYYDTLVSYICSLGSPKDTCSRLFIHRNTLTYRLNRIEELTGISLSDPDVFLHLMCCIYIQNAQPSLFPKPELD